MRIVTIVLVLTTLLLSAACSRSGGSAGAVAPAPGPSLLGKWSSPNSLEAAPSTFHTGDIYAMEILADVIVLKKVVVFEAFVPQGKPAKNYTSPPETWQYKIVDATHLTMSTPYRTVTYDYALDDNTLTLSETGQAGSVKQTFRRTGQ